MEDRPTGRKKNVGTGGSGVHRREEAQGYSGPVGGSNGLPPGSSGTGPSGSGAGGGGSQRGAGGRSPLFMIIAIIAVLMLGGGGGLSALLGGGGSGTSLTDYTSTTTTAPATSTQTQSSQGVSTSTGTSTGSGMSSMLGSLLGGGYGSYMGASGGGNAAWSSDSNTGKLNTEVASAARAKRTTILGQGRDVVTIMVYMCGADLESRSGMASRDLQEMLAADFGDNVNLVIYTGGAKQWQNNVVSSSTNQIYQIKNKQLVRLQDNLGSVPMTKADTLSGYIKWAAKNFPANRNVLIFWDHGGGTTGGYGYDEKFPTAGAMSLAGINTALKDGGVTFDFVGFDTCLMATVENALVVSNYADYLVASEETEPGVGWYYTDWLTALGKDTSMETLQIGKNIIDSFTSACAQTCPGQKTTLSLIDLAELSQTVPSELADFSKDTTELIKNNNYQAVSNARSSTREFAQSSRIDQVDLVDFATRMGTDEAKELADTLRSAIKYNRTSSNMTHAYGLSIYFPYQQSRKVDSVCNTYDDIGMDEEYKNCIASFASMNTYGQAASGGTGSAMPSLFGDLSGMGTGSGSSGGSSAELIGQLLNTFLSSDFSSVSGLSASNTSFLGRGVDVDYAASYIAEHQFNGANLLWTKNAAGEDVISLPDDQWAMVQDLELNMYYDDGQGFLNLGYDNVMDFDEDGNLKAQDDKTWLAIDGQIVSYYFIDMQKNGDKYAIYGRVPCEINGERANLILVFDSDNEDGYVAGACRDYVEGETDTIAKNLIELQTGDKIDYVCDGYTYDKKFQGVYYIGDTVTVQKDMKDMVIENLPVGDGTAYMTYRFTDIYNQNYWTNTLTY